MLRLVVPAGLVCPNLVPTTVEPWLCVPEQESSPAAKIEEEKWKKMEKFTKLHQAAIN